MESKPLVSVCVPTYNGGQYLATCLDSLLDQTMQDLEILVGDDVSQDDTLEIARRRNDPRVHVMPFATRAGMAGNWNRCLSEARGKYVSLVAQDDRVEPRWAERLVELLESHPQADLAFGRRDFDLNDDRTREVVGDFFETKYPAMVERFYSRIGTVIPSDLMIDAAMQHRFKINLIGEPSFTMVRRDHPATRAGYHVGMKQLLDWEFATRFFAERPILHCPERIGTYHVHAAGLSVDKAPLSLQYEEYKHLLDSVLERFQPRLNPIQISILVERRDEVEHVAQLLAHTRSVESEREQLIAHANSLDDERTQLIAHAKTLESDLEKLEPHARELEAEIRRLRIHAKAVESEADHLRGHVQNLERILGKIHGEKIYGALCRIKDTFVRRT